jgi:hypothetical protein
MFAVCAEDVTRAGRGGGGGGGGGGAGAGAGAGTEAFNSPAYTKTVKREFGRINVTLRVLQLPLVALRLWGQRLPLATAATGGASQLQRGLRALPAPRDASLFAR